MIATAQTNCLVITHLHAIVVIIRPPVITATIHLAIATKFLVIAVTIVRLHANAKTHARPANIVLRVGVATIMSPFQYPLNVNVISSKARLVIDSCAHIMMWKGLWEMWCRIL